MTYNTRGSARTLFSRTLSDPPDAVSGSSDGLTVPAQSPFSHDSAQRPRALRAIRFLGSARISAQHFRMELFNNAECTIQNLNY